MPERQGYDSISIIAIRKERTDDDHKQCHMSSQRRFVPIRMPQSSQQAAHLVAHLTSLPEHSLRRKTPSGTVDAGYDGSNVQSFLGQPLKHMILPKPSNSESPSRLNHSPVSLRNRNHSTSVIPSDRAIQPQASYLRNLWTCNVGSSSTLNLMSNSSHPAMAGRPYSEQPVVQANDHNVRAFCPPPGPSSSSILLGQVAWHLGIPLWDHRIHGHGNHVATGCTSQGGLQLAHGSLADSALQHHTLYVQNHDMLTTRNQTLNGSQWPSQSCRGSKALLPAQTTILNGQPHSREEVLQFSHQSYVDLLSYLQANGKSNPTRSSPSTFDTQRLPTYPKPPRLRSNGRFIGTDCTGSHSSPPNNSAVPAMLRTRRDTFDRSGPTYSEMCNGHAIHGHSCNTAHRPLRLDSNSSLSSSAYVAPGEPSPIANALSSVEILNTLCEQSGWRWVEGMLVGGCLEYGLELYDDALKCFSRIVALDPGHVEALTHMGAALYCLGRQEEAEQNWLHVVSIRPTYLEATEHLVGHLYKHRSEKAVEVISYVQRSSFRATRVPTFKDDTRITSDASHGKFSSVSNDLGLGSSTRVESSEESIGFGSSGYLFPGVDNGRLLALVHAKGTMLYGQQDIERASEAFEEAVLISVGRRVGGIQELTHLIQRALSPQLQCRQKAHETSTARSLQALMLPPERARQTARLLFGSNGELPGLIHLGNSLSKRAAVQTTSNSLLSLAKILQDAMSNGSADSCLLHGASQVSDILTLYYLSLSLQESPSTANNVGILLAGLQQSIATGSMHAPSKILPQPGIPGIAPGSGLALALAYYNYGLRLDPNHVHLHTNLGSLLKDIGQLDLAIQMYERAVLCDGTFDIALTNLANAVKDKGRIYEAIVYYRRAVNVNPRFAEAVCGLFTALNSVCDWHGRGGMLLDSGQYDRWHVGDDGRLVDVRISRCSSGLTKRAVDIVVQQLKDASHWGLGVLQEAAIHSLAGQLQHLCKDPSFKLDDALSRWAGQPWEGSRLLRLIERATRIIQRKWYEDLHQTIGQVDVGYWRPKIPQNLAVPSAPTLLPFHTFTCPLSAEKIRTIAQRNAARISCSTLRSPWISTTVYPPPKPPRPQLNVGYLSSDFNNHPLAHL
ncbi:hypothetical protein E4U41_005712 [Claviceps citrina]|nr:hypothetical protein E4U41_005712 [Claviceps citrina]